MRRLRLRDERGVTLIEMIMVLAILGIVLTGITTVFITGSRAELQVSNRFQAQEASRLALAAIRKDAHNACTAVVTGVTMLTLSVPPVATEQCGVTNAAKIVWVVCTSPTVSTKFALYRLTVVPSPACPSSGKLVADNLINTLTSYKGFFQSTLLITPPAPVGWAGSINWGETETVDVDIPVSLKQGTAGVPFDLRERLALSNTVWSATAGRTCSTLVPCIQGPCNNVTDPITLIPAPCFPPALS